MPMLNQLPNLKSYKGRSQLLFLLIVVSLYLPIPFNSFFIGLFILHSFFTRDYFLNLKKADWIPITLLIAFFAVNAFSLLYTEDLQRGIPKLETKLSFLLMPLAIGGSGLYRSTGFRRAVLNVFFWATIFAALAALINAAVTSFEAGAFSQIADDEGTMVKQYFFTYTHLAFFIMHPGYFSLYVSTAIFIGIYLLLTNTAWIRWRWLQLFLMAFLFVFLFLLQGRMSILAFLLLLFLGVLIYFFSTGNYWKGLILVTFPILFVILVVIFAPPNLTRRFTEFTSLDYQLDAPSVYNFNGFTLRLAEWECALDAAKEKPLTGYGLGDAFEALMESYRENNFVVGLHRKYNAHNQYMETLLQTGIPGVLILLAIFGWFLYRSFRSRDLLLFALSSLLFISMITESMFERHWAISFFCSLLVFLGLSSRHRKVRLFGEKK